MWPASRSTWPASLSPQWEAFASYSWLPVAKIDISSAATGERQGDRPSLTPQHSGSGVDDLRAERRSWRVGGGLTARSGMQPIRNPGYYAKGWVTGDLMAEYRVSGAPLVFKANLSNVTEQAVCRRALLGPLHPGRRAPVPTDRLHHRSEHADHPARCAEPRAAREAARAAVGRS